MTEGAPASIKMPRVTFCRCTKGGVITAACYECARLPDALPTLRNRTPRFNSSFRFYSARDARKEKNANRPLTKLPRSDTYALCAKQPLRQSSFCRYSALCTYAVMSYQNIYACNVVSDTRSTMETEALVLSSIISHNFIFFMI